MNHQIRFEQSQVWDIDHFDNPFWIQKLRVIVSLIPDDVVTILDVGCGDGETSKILRKHWKIVNTDLSWAAISKAPAPAVHASGSCLPFDQHAFDLTLVSEVLEHLPNNGLSSVVNELKHVSKQWILISVPFNEDLAVRHMKCPRCGLVFHAYGHIQRFNLSRLKKFFNGWSLSAWTHCGNPSPRRYQSLVLWLRQRIGQRWFYVDSAYAICPRCENDDFKSTHGNRITRICDHLNAIYLEWASAWPYWVVVLFERNN